MPEQPRETAGLTMRLIISYVRHRRGPAGVEELLQAAGERRPLDVLENERVWSSYDAKIALFAAAADLTGEPDIGRRIGRFVLDSSVGASVRIMLGLFASPAALLRHVAGAGAKFTSCATMRAHEVGRTSAIVSYRLHDGYTPSRFDCDYTMGLLSQVPAVFGQPPAAIRHERCQVEGAEECVYDVRWHPHRLRVPFRRRRLDEHVVHQRLQDLQHAVTEIVGSRETDVETVLRRVAERAAYAVNAPRFLLVARMAPGAEPRLHADGFAAGEADALAERLLAGKRAPGPDACITAPVRSTSHDYGLLAAFASAPFLPPEQELLEAYAALAAAALDALVARRAAEERRHTAEVLLEFSDSVAAAGDRDAVAAATAEALRQMTECDVASVVLFSPGEDHAHVAAHSGFTPAQVEVLLRYPLRRQDTPYVGDVLTRSWSPVLLTRDGGGPDLRRNLTALDVGVIVGVGLRSAGDVQGALFAGWRDPGMPVDLGESLVYRMKGLAGQTSIALEKADLLSQVRRQAETDPLTGLVNRRFFTERLEACLTSGEDGEVVGAVLFLDLDGFKAVNDTLGHAVGDELLRVVATRLTACVRTEDVVSRLGGDEFTVLLLGPHTEEAVEQFSARVLAALAEPIALAGTSVRTRPSIGGALVRAGTAAGDALREADQAMYRAKAAGGGRLIMAA